MIRVMMRALSFPWLAATCVLLAFTALGLDAVAQQPNAAVKVMRDVEYGPHGARNSMDLYLPSNAEGPRPTVICIHGGGWAGGDKRAYGWLAEEFAERGFAAVSITYRFAPQWTAPTQMDDVQRAVRWLRKNASQYRLDPDRFGAIGGSAGGHLASYLALADTRDNSDEELREYSSRVQCAVDCYGPVDLQAMMQSASAGIVRQFIGKDLKENEEAYRAASPSWMVRDNPPPMLILHGTLDIGNRPGQVPIEQSIEFSEKLRRAGGEVTLLKLERAGHGFSHSRDNEHAQKSLEAATEFFAKHLKHEVDGQ